MSIYSAVSIYSFHRERSLSSDRFDFRGFFLCCLPAFFKYHASFLISIKIIRLFGLKPQAFMLNGTLLVYFSNKNRPHPCILNLMNCKISLCWFAWIIILKVHTAYFWQLVDNSTMTFRNKLYTPYFINYKAYQVLLLLTLVET